MTPFLDAAKSDQEWLFPTKLSVTGHTVNIEKQFRRAVTSAGLNPKEVSTLAKNWQNLY